MSVRISEIVGFDPEASNPVMPLNMYKYLWQLFGAKGFRAKDQTLPAMECDGSNVVFVAGEKQLYRGYIGGLDVDGTTMRATKRPAEEQLRTYVAKRNRVTGQMRLVEVETCQLSNVRHDRTREEQGSNAPMDVLTLQKLQQKYDSKSSQALMRRLKSQQFDLGIVEQKLRQTIADCVVKDKGGVAGTSTAEPKAEGDVNELAKVEAEIRAKANPQAEQLCDLYRAEALIGPDLFRQLTKPAQKLLEVAPEELSMANEYLETRVKALMQSPDVTSESTVNHARICLYMDVLARLICKDRARAGGRGSVSPFTTILDEPIRKQFMQYNFLYVRERPTVTKYTRHKALMYYLALAFVLEGKPLVSARMLHQSLNLSKTELIPFARAIGARYETKRDMFALGTLRKPPTEDMELLRAIESGGRRSGRS